MKNILIVYPQIINPQTGGQVYDFSFIKLLEQYKNNRYNIMYLLDKDIKAKTKLGFILKYLKKIKYMSRFDFIITNSRLYPRLLLCFLFLRNCKVILLHHHFNFMAQYNALNKIIHKFFELRFINLSTIVIAASKYTEINTKKFCPSVIVSHIDTSFEKKINQELKKDLNINNKPITLLYVGAVIKRKGIEYLMKMALYLKNKNYSFKLVIAGECSDSKYLKKCFKIIDRYSLHNHLEFMGRISNTELEQLYIKSSIFVFPSLHEGYGRVIIEAMSYSMPVIGFNNSAMPYTINEGVNGFLVKNKDSNGFNNQVELLMNSSDLYKYLSKNAFNTYLEAHSERDFENEVSAFIDELILYSENKKMFQSISWK